jgi:NAD(P)-dependent dehydrogenase (short-subunit alcohol dehydrogenase family)
MGAYTAAHATPNGAGDARPTAIQIIKDNGVEGNFKGKVIVVTGGGSGLGLETVRALSITGATIFVTVRDIKKAEASLQGILEPGRVSIIQMDNNSFASVRTAAAAILDQSNSQVNILIGNAGVMGFPERMVTADGHEFHFQTNHLSHFLLFQLLKPALLATTSPSFASRVVILASSAHRATTLFASDNYSFENAAYDHTAAYNNSKLANIYMANELERRYGAQGVHALSVHPGVIHNSIVRNLDQEVVDAVVGNPVVARLLKSNEQGAATTVLAAIGKEWEGRGGRYLEDCEEAKRGEDDLSPFSFGWVKQTYDAESEARLWKDSMKIVGVSE